MWSGLKNYSDAALLIVRVTLGALILWLHGWPKLAGGIGAWRHFAAHDLHITLWPTFFGFLGTIAETLGCVLLILGLLFRPSALLLLIFTALVAFAEHHAGGFGGAEQATVRCLFFLLLLFIGPGKFSFDKS